MFNILITNDNQKIKIYSEGVLIIEETSYTKIVLIISELKNVIQDEYQLKVLDEILKLVKLRMVA